MALQIKDANGAVVNTPRFDKAYSASLVGFVPAIQTNATLCQVVTIIGVAAVVARLKRIRLTARKAVLGFVAVRLERWSTLGTLGSAVATAIPTIARHGSPTAPGSAPSAPGIAVASIGTAAYTTAGTVAGIIANRNVAAKSTTVVDSAVDAWEVTFGNKGDAVVEVCGATDSLVLSATPIVGDVTLNYDIEVQWEEGTV